MPDPMTKMPDPLIAKIVRVSPDYIAFTSSRAEVQHVISTFDIEIKVVSGYLTYDQAVDYINSGQKFKLVPIDGDPLDKEE